MVTVDRIVQGGAVVDLVVRVDNVQAARQRRKRASKAAGPPAYEARVFDPTGSVLLIFRESGARRRTAPRPWGDAQLTSRPTSAPHARGAADYVHIVKPGRTLKISGKAVTVGGKLQIHGALRPPGGCDTPVGGG